MAARNPKGALRKMGVDFHTMLSRMPASKEEPGCVEIQTFMPLEDDIPAEYKNMYEPLPYWQYIDCLQKRTCPLEKLITEDKLKKMSSEELHEYAMTIDYWKTIWWVQKYRHWHQEVRTTELVGQKTEQNFWRCPPLAIPIQADVLKFTWEDFIAAHRTFCNGRMFDCIVTDPPWTLATEKSTRGVALNYDQITDKLLLNAVPWSDLLNENGVIFMWVINAKLVWAVDWLEDQGLTVVECMTWLKMSTNRLMARGHGYYLQHAKEDCIIAVKGDTKHFTWETLTSSMVAEKRNQSQKPADFYDMVEQFAPEHSHFCEVFGRRNNLRNGWVTIGNQL